MGEEVLSSSLEAAGDSAIAASGEACSDVSSGASSGSSIAESSGRGRPAPPAPRGPKDGEQVTDGDLRDIPPRG